MLLIEGGEIQTRKGSNRSQTPLHVPCFYKSDSGSAQCMLELACTVPWSMFRCFASQLS